MFRKPERKEKKLEANPMQLQQPPTWYLTDFSVIKEWPKYGLNRTLTHLALRTATEIKMEEYLAGKKKEGRDWTQIMMFVTVAVIVGVISFVMVTQFMNFSEMAKENADNLAKLGTCRGELNAATAQLLKESGETAPHQIIPG